LTSLLKYAGGFTTNKKNDEELAYTPS